MQTTAQSLQEELGTDLLSQLSVDDQVEVDKLNDQIQFVTNENRSALKERVKVSRQGRHSDIFAVTVHIVGIEKDESEASVLYVVVLLYCTWCCT